MRKLKEIIRLHASGLSNRQVAKSIKVSPSTVSVIINRAEKAEISWPLPEKMSDSDLETALYPTTTRTDAKPMPDWSEIHKELKRPHVTLQLLWEEYLDSHPKGYRYSFFCELYQNWRKKLEPSMRQDHKAGEKMFVDFAGQTVDIQDPKTSVVKPAQIFIAVLGASNYAFVQAAFSQELQNWIHLHCLSFEFFQGVPEIIVPDNLRSGVSRSCRYEPDVNPTYHEMAEHYGGVVIPGRPYRPKDKSKAENAVLHVERQILARLRNRTFFSLEELNQAILKELKVLNEKPFQKLDGSRKSWYQELDKKALMPLPSERYIFAQWKKLKVNIDYHVELEKNYYSVPYQLVREKVEVRFTTFTVEILHKGKRITSHTRLSGKGIRSTNPEHMPASHRKHLEWTPTRIINWAKKSGKSTAHLVQELMNQKAHPEQAYRSCLGIIRLGDKYSNERLETACRRAIDFNGFSYGSVKSILQNGLDLVEPEKQNVLPLPSHGNIRGASYYKNKEDKSC